MVKGKLKPKGTSQSVLETPSGGRQSDGSKRSSPEFEHSPAPVATTTATATAETSIDTETVAGPSAKKAKLQQQLKTVEKQV